MVQSCGRTLITSVFSALTDISLDGRVRCFVTLFARRLEATAPYDSDLAVDVLFVLPTERDFIARDFVLLIAVHIKVADIVRQFGHVLRSARNVRTFTVDL